MKTWLLTTLLLGAGLLPACTSIFEQTVEGSGVGLRESRTIGSIDEVHVAGAMDVRIDVGAGPLVIVDGDDNLVPYVETEVDGGTLRVRVRRGYRLDPAPRVEVHLPELRGFTLAGSGEVEIAGVRGSSLEIEIAGSGDVTADGEVGELSIEIAGSGAMDLTGLRAGDVNVRIAGSGDVRVHAEDALDVRVAGSGDVVYTGQPRVSQQVAGSGRVRAAE